VKTIFDKTANDQHYQVWVSNGNYGTLGAGDLADRERALLHLICDGHPGESLLERARGWKERAAA